MWGFPGFAKMSKILETAVFFLTKAQKHITLNRYNWGKMGIGKTGFGNTFSIREEPLELPRHTLLYEQIPKSEETVCAPAAF